MNVDRKEISGAGCFSDVPLVVFCVLRNLSITCLLCLKNDASLKGFKNMEEPRY